VSKNELEHILDDRLSPVQRRLPFSRNLSRARIDIPQERVNILFPLIQVALEYHDEHPEQCSEWLINDEKQRLIALQHALGSRSVSHSLYDAACLDILYARIGKIGESRKAFYEDIRTTKSRFEP